MPEDCGEKNTSAEIAATGTRRMMIARMSNGGRLNTKRIMTWVTFTLNRCVAHPPAWGDIYKDLRRPTRKSVPC
jgi:hypothetical protein